MKQLFMGCLNGWIYDEFIINFEKVYIATAIFFYLYPVYSQICPFGHLY
jgi:hypothetical protein